MGFWISFSHSFQIGVDKVWQDVFQWLYRIFTGRISIILEYICLSPAMVDMLDDGINSIFFCLTSITYLGSLVVRFSRVSDGRFWS